MSELDDAFHAAERLRSDKPKIYSAPRRLDLATIFVVTFAYSILFGVMSFYKFRLVSSLMIGGFITVVGLGQALLFSGVKPRAASVLTGVCTCILATIGFYLYDPSVEEIKGEFLAAVIYFGAAGGAFMGYLAGVLVGGVFLVADALRRVIRRSRNLSTDVGSHDKLD